MQTSSTACVRSHEHTRALRRMFLCVEGPRDFRKIFGRSSEADEFMLSRADAIHLGDARDEEIEKFLDQTSALIGVRHLFEGSNASDAIVAFVVQRHPGIHRHPWRPDAPARCVLAAQGDAADFSSVSATLTDNDLHRFLLRHGSNLRSITLSRCALITEAALGCVAAACASTLRHLRADYCTSLSGRGISLLLRRCGLLNLEEFTFRRCENVAGVVIPGHIRVIPQGCFCYCVALRCVVVPPELLRIEQAAFWGCKQLRTCDVPTATAIDPWAFAGCGLLYPQDAKWTKMYDT